MTFRVKLRIKSVKPHYPVKAAPVSPGIPQIAVDPELLRRLYEAAKDARPADDGQWTRRWMRGPGLPDPRLNPTCTMNVPPGAYTLWN